MTESAESDDKPSEPVITVLAWIFKITLGGVSVLALGWALLFIEPNRYLGWAYVDFLAIVGVLVGTALLRAPWMILIVVAACSLAMSSCEHTFHLGG